MPEGQLRARPGGDLPLARAEVQRAPRRRSARAREHVREHGAKPPPAYLQSAGYPGAARARARRRATTTPTTARATCPTQELLPDGRRGRALLRARRRRGGAARAPGGDPPGARAVDARARRGGDRSRSHSSSPSARPPASGWARWRWPRPRDVAAAVDEAASGAAAVGEAAPRRPRALHGPRRAGGHRRVRRAGRPHRRRAGPAARRGRGHGAAARGRDAAVAGRARPAASWPASGSRFSRTQHPVKRGRWSYEPLGVVGVLGPAAEPFATPLGDVAVALMAGNGVVLKPSPHVPLCGERIARVFARAGLPEGLLRVVHGHADAGARARRRARCAQVRFTGSARARAARSARRARAASSAACSTLGGNDAMLVLADANVPRAVARRGVGGVRQRRASAAAAVERALVRARGPRPLPRRASSQAARGAARRRPAPTRRRRSARSSPASALERVRALVDEAVAAGATLHCGGAASRATALLRAGRAHRRDAGDAPRARGGARARCSSVEAVDTEEEAIARGQRGDARARRVGVDGRPLQGRAHRPRAARRDGVDERPPRGALGARRSRGAASAARASAAPAARSRCARAPSRASSPGTRRSAARCGGFPTTRRSSAPRAPSPACAARATATASARGAATASRCCASRAAGCGRCAAVRPLARARRGRAPRAACRTAWETEPSSALPTRPSPRVPITSRSWRPSRSALEDHLRGLAGGRRCSSPRRRRAARRSA